MFGLVREDSEYEFVIQVLLNPYSFYLSIVFCGITRYLRS